MVGVDICSCVIFSYILKFSLLDKIYTCLGVPDDDGGSRSGRGRRRCPHAGTSCVVSTCSDQAHIFIIYIFINVCLFLEGLGFHILIVTSSLVGVLLESAQESRVDGLHTGGADEGSHEPVVNTFHVVSMHTG